MRYLSPGLSLPLAASVLLACGGGPSEPDPMETSIEVTSATSGLLGYDRRLHGSPGRGDPAVYWCQRPNGVYRGSARGP